MNYILDLIFIAILILSIIITAKKGFIRSIISVAAVIISIAVAMMLAPPVSEYVYNELLKDKIYDSTYTAISSAVAESEISINEKIESIYDSLPPILSGFTGLESDDLTDIVSQNSFDADAITNDIFNNLIDPAIKTLINYIFVLIFFVVILFLSNLIARLLTGMIRGNLLGSINTALGALLGCISGSVFVIVAFMIINLLVSLFSIEPLADAITDSRICGFLSDIL